MRKKIAGIVWIAMLTVIFAGCTASSGKEPGDEKEEATDYKTLTFDNYGREIVVKEKPSDVLTFGPNATELFIALGLSDYIIGNSLDNHSRGALPAYEEDYAKVPELTYGSATREAVLTSGADFIYGIDWEFGEAGLDLEELENYQITTYLNSAATLEEMYREIRDIGSIFEVQDRADAFVEEQKERISVVQEKVSGREPVDVLVYDSGGNGVFTAGGSNFESLLIKYAGGKNIFDDITDKQWATVSYEEVLARQPDVIVIHDYDAPSLEQKIENIKNDPALSQLESVKKERFVAISLESVLPGNRMAYTVETLAEGFYPGLSE